VWIELTAWRLGPVGWRRVFIESEIASLLQKLVAIAAGLFRQAG
jgi:hypothetical protein